MSGLTFGENDLLEYNHTYKILICRKCQYAIQKNAVDSHLLRHKIYRGERQTLLSSIGQLDLVEPENVPLPPPDSPPVAALPVLSGFCCTAAGCSHLTASSKRMRRHWSETHDLDGAVAITPSLARQVKLQTFFRGTKVRYFEVASSSSTSAEAVGDDDADSSTEDFAVPEEEFREGVPMSLPSSLPHSILPSTSNSEREFAVSDFNMEILFYFHHFTATTAFTLPSPVSSHYVRNYWLMQRVPEALQLHWLMCGYLAVSALHLAGTADDGPTRKMHEERKSEFASRFRTGFEQMRAGAFISGSADTKQSVQEAAEQLNSLLECARWVLPVMTIVGNLGIPTQPHLIMSTIRGCEVAVRVPYYTDNDFSDIDVGNLSGIVYGDPIHSLHETHAHSNTPSSTIVRLQMLPSRIAERLERPDNANDVLAIITALQALIRSCEISYSSNETHVVWRAAVSWLKNIPPYYEQLVVQYHPAALILLAHWARILVKRAADCGCWFLRNLVDEVMLQLLKYFSNNCASLMDLVVDLTHSIEGDM